MKEDMNNEMTEVPIGWVVAHAVYFKKHEDLRLAVHLFLQHLVKFAQMESEERQKDTTIREMMIKLDTLNNNAQNASRIMSSQVSEGMERLMNQFIKFNDGDITGSTIDDFIKRGGNDETD